MSTPDNERDEYSWEILDDVSIWERVDTFNSEEVFDKFREDIEKIACLWED